MSQAPKERLETCLDLFSGAGGFTCGARWAGLSVAQSVEANQRAAKTYSKNNPDVDVVLGDITSLDPEACLDRIGLDIGDIDVLIAGTPCQGFSESNRRTRTLDNPKNTLYTEVIRFARTVTPRCIVLENVAGLRTLAKGAVLAAIILDLERLGYHVGWKVVCSADYGVPQFRNRLFIVASQIRLAHYFPRATHGGDGLGYVTVKDAISDLPILRNGSMPDVARYRGNASPTAYGLKMRGSRNTESVQGNLVTNSSPLILERYSHIRPGENWRAIPPALMTNYQDSSRCHTGIYYRLKWHQPSKVLGNFRKNMLIHPSQNRGLSVREAARLQSFPDSYEFVGSIGFQQQQVADAVPPLLAMAVLRHLRREYRAAIRRSVAQSVVEENAA